MTKENCYFCNLSATKSDIPQIHSSNRYDCSFCGSYIIDDMIDHDIADIKQNKEEVKFKVSCILNERRLRKLSGVAISDTTNQDRIICGMPEISLKDLLDQYPKSANELLERSLLNLERLAIRPFSEIIVLDEILPRLFFCNKPTELVNFKSEFLALGYIKKTREVRGQVHFMITKEGWEFINAIRKKGIESNQAFVAMWFDQSMNDIYENGIKQAIKKAGYDSLRIDAKDHNNKICDEIIAEIRRSKFVVADFSGQRGGVYYEAGFAHGLGREVIFTVKADDMENVHFDTDHYNHITYNDAEELRKKLYNRIRATIV